MSLSEMTMIVVLFHTMRGRQVNTFYRGLVCRFMTSEFPRQLSYTRFVALMSRCSFSACHQLIERNHRTSKVKST